LSNELEHSRSLNHEFRKVTSRVVTPVRPYLELQPGIVIPYTVDVGVAYCISPYSTVITVGFCHSHWQFSGVVTRSQTVFGWSQIVIQSQL